MLRGQGQPDLRPYALNSFLSSDILLVDDALSEFPPSSTYRGKYIRVSDLHGAQDGVMRCGLDSVSGLYYWQPTTPEYGRTMAMTQDLVLNPLKCPTSINLTGSIGVGITRVVTLGTLNGRPGEIREVKNSLSTLLGSLTLLGTGLGAGVASVLGGYQKFFLDFQAGQLTWVRLV